jgi:hypothetical protein
VSLLVMARRSPVALGLLGLLGAAFVYYAADYVGVLANFPLLSFQANDMVDAILAAGAGLGALEVWRFARGSEALRARLGRGGVTATFGVLATVVAFSLAQSAVKHIPYVSEQRQSQVPVQELDDFRHAAHGQVTDRVVLTDITELPVYLPVYVFNWWNAHYMNPPARFNDRSAFLHKLSDEADPAVVALALVHNVYDRVDYVALRPDPSGNFQYQFSADAFPRGAVGVTYTFPAKLFSAPVFRRTPTSSFTFFRIDRSRDPLAGLQRCARAPTGRDCSALGRVATRYRGDVDDRVLQLAARWAAARRRA